MKIEEVVLWYEKNVNYKITKAFLNFLVKIGIIKIDVDLELLNLFLLDRFDNEYVKDDKEKYKIKKNRIPVIEQYEEKAVIKSNNNDGFKKPNMIVEKGKKIGKKFKIESLGGKKMKLIKL